MKSKCFNGKILHVDLSERRTWVETPGEAFYRSYGGGSAMGLYYILKEMPACTDALSAENILTVFLGVPTGLPISGQSRVTITARSPLTNAIGDSQAGGFFPARMKAARFDGIVIRGKAAQPVYLWINDGEVEIRDASHLWGKLTGECDDLIKQELNDKRVEILQIGPAGENMVRFAAVMNMCNRANGRTGMGAVMGSKNLKAIAVQGSYKPTAANPKLIQSMVKDGTARIKENPVIESFYLHGTAGDVPVMHAAGGLPTHNFNQGQFEGNEAISGEVVTESLLKERSTCFACSVRCKRMVQTHFEGQDVLPRYGGAEYETTAAFGSYCGVSDLHAVQLANQLCNQYGMDTISCGATIAFAMECFENELLTLNDTQGIDLHFGNASSMVKMVEKIAKRQGLGNMLAEGSVRAARAIGRNAVEFLVTAKGQELPAHMPQSKRAMGLIYAVNPFGADHESSEHDPTYEQGIADEQSIERMAQLGLTDLQPYGELTGEKARMVAVTQKVYSALDSFCMCAFVWGSGFQLYSTQELVDFINAAAGWDMSLEELLCVGERRINMMRAFNAREGFSRQDDTLSAKFFRPLQGSGPCAGVSMSFEQLEDAKDSYYGFMGWDVQTGNPTREKLASLALDWVEM